MSDRPSSPRTRGFVTYWLVVLVAAGAMLSVAVLSGAAHAAVVDMIHAR